MRKIRSRAEIEKEVAFGMSVNAKQDLIITLLLDIRDAVMEGRAGKINTFVGQTADHTSPTNLDK